MPILDPHAAARFVVVLIIAGLVAWGLFESRAEAQQPSLKEWFNSLRSPAGLVCCHNFDGISLEEDEWRPHGDKYQVRFKGEWIDVPESALITEPNRLGRAHLWMNANGTVRCFIGGALT